MRRLAPLLAPAFIGLGALTGVASGACDPGGAHGGANAAAAASGSALASASGSAPSGSTQVPVTPAPPPPDLAGPPPNAQRSLSGLASIVLQPGTGVVHPEPEDAVGFHFVAWDKKGTTVGNSFATDSPVSMRAAQVIEGLTEGLHLMVAGEKRRFWIPARLAYSERPFRKAPAGDLVFDVELLIVRPTPKPPPPPADVSGVPKTAKRTSSGLAYRHLKQGDGNSPKGTDGVEVHYTGWTIDGRMFDSSVAKGKPVKLRLNQVIKGWTEGLQLMKAGDKVRFWVPADLAYGDVPTRPGAPAGMLVFDVELLAVFDPTTVTNPHEMTQ
ncbi:MAG TPA: FKBP-type peptidyl-prolyl cis-trans isomerase [Polyangiaceae bacterium]|nr:FKBP-type peptidyl-prolyl cis-trans isomerase [Polyangiaceae bacterium]